MNAEQILLVVFRISVIVFVVIAIFFVVQLIQISRNVKSLAEKVDDAASNVVSVSEAFRKLATPIALGSVFGNFAGKFSKARKKRGNK